MAQVDNVLKDLYRDIMKNGISRDTRTGPVTSVWNRSLEFDLQVGFPAVTSKKLAWNAVVGELLWFLSGSSSLADLKHYTFGDRNSDKWTIWTDDANRWGDGEFVGDLYPKQWRDFGGECSGTGTDQILNLINQLKSSPTNRDHIVMAWNPYDIEHDSMALKPCHLGFQCYVTPTGELNLHWFQRSVDSFLGLPFNIASYALLTHLLAHWTGLKVGKLSCWLGDTHLYNNHEDAVDTFLINPKFNECKLFMPPASNTLRNTIEHATAVDFKDNLIGYNSMGLVKAKLSVG